MQFGRKVVRFVVRVVVRVRVGVRVRVRVRVRVTIKGPGCRGGISSLLYRLRARKIIKSKTINQRIPNPNPNPNNNNNNSKKKKRGGRGANCVETRELVRKGSDAMRMGSGDLVFEMMQAECIRVLECD